MVWSGHGVAWVEEVSQTHGMRCLVVEKRCKSIPYISSGLSNVRRMGTSHGKEALGRNCACYRYILRTEKMLPCMETKKNVVRSQQLRCCCVWSMLIRRYSQARLDRQPRSHCAIARTYDVTASAHVRTHRCVRVSVSARAHTHLSARSRTYPRAPPTCMHARACGNMCSRGYTGRPHALRSAEALSRTENLEPTRDAGSSGAAACARRRELSQSVLLNQLQAIMSHKRFQTSQTSDFGSGSWCVPLKQGCAIVFYVDLWCRHGAVLLHTCHVQICEISRVGGRRCLGGIEDARKGAVDSGDGSEVFCWCWWWQLQGLSLSWTPAPLLNFWSDRATELVPEVSISSSADPVGGRWVVTTKKKPVEKRCLPSTFYNSGGILMQHNH